MRRVAVLGLGVAGEATARELARRGVDVRLADDSSRPEHRRLADELSAPLWSPLAPDERSGFLADADTLVPAPGVSPCKQKLSACRGQRRPCRSRTWRSRMARSTCSAAVSAPDSRAPGSLRGTSRVASWYARSAKASCTARRPARVAACGSALPARP